MNSVLILQHIRVENASAIAGLTYGFPSVSGFLGYTHALSRTLQEQHGLSLGGCGVVCHSHQLLAHRASRWTDYRFSLTRNPLTKEGLSSSFVEEGRMHMDVSLIIECCFDADEIEFHASTSEEDVVRFKSFVLQEALRKRLAGGTVQSIGKVEFIELESSNSAHMIRKALLGLLPGFALIERSDLLRKHLRDMQKQDVGAGLFNAWLDFITVKSGVVPRLPQSEALEDDGAGNNRYYLWQPISRPAPGYLRPITVGFKAISPLYANGSVAGCRDPDVPFRFVEAAYSIGQWISPHRLTNFEQLLWRYSVEDEWYLCRNDYQPVEPETEIQSQQ